MQLLVVVLIASTSVSLGAPFLLSKVKTVIIKKAPKWVPFLLAGLLFSVNGFAQSDCGPHAAAQAVRVQYVFDGDTVKLDDGRKIRLAAINTPELGRDGAPNQPVALQAKKWVEQFTSSQLLQFQLASRKRDRYGRSLGYLFDQSGQSLAQQLVARGLAFHVPYDGSLAFSDCLRRAESQARAKKRGVWGTAYWQPKEVTKLTKSDQGFRVVRGQVERIKKTSKGLWITLGGAVSVFVAKEKGVLPRLRVGSRVEVKGWLVPRSSGSRWILKLSALQALTILYE